MQILIVDATNNFLRNYSVVPTLTSNGEPNGGVYGFLNSLAYFIRITKPDKVVLCWDGVGGSKKRRAIIKDYKQGRKPVRLNRNFEFEFENLEQNKIRQRLRLGQYLDDLPVTQIAVEEVEADDVVAYLTKMYENDRKIIVSSDKDFYQLLDENTVIFVPTKKNFLNNRAVLEKFKIHPNNFALARAIVGDKTDNLVGVRGIGMVNVVKFFPMLTESKKVELDQLFEFCKQSGEKYDRFLQNQEVIINNLKVMKLDSILIGNHSIDKIHESLEKPLQLNATSFRLKLFEDGINSFGENYLHAFRVLETKGKQ